MPSSTEQPRLIDPEQGTALTGLLPVPAAPLLGRQASLTSLRDLLTRRQARLLTLTGAGGTGKSRLALELASELRSEFDRIWFVDLTTVRDPELVLSAVAQAIDVQGAGSAPLAAILQGVLSKQSTLLILDNFEHVLDAAGYIANLVETCPPLAVIATSREALGLRSENVYFLEPLPVPDLNHLEDSAVIREVPSVQLFEERARARRAGFQLTDELVPAVAEICVRLDGLPLAIELAAAQAAVFSPLAILKRLQVRAGFVGTVQRDLPIRHQTLEATVAWSYELLEPNEQAVFLLCGVFSGGFSAAALEHVALTVAPGVDGLACLAQLVTKSLVRVVDDTAVEPRFWLLGTIREYAEDRLARSSELTEARARHADYFVGMAEQLKSSMRGPGIAEALQRVAHDYGNFRSVFQWASDTDDPVTILRLAAALYRYWLARGPLPEGRAWLEPALRQARAAPPPIRAEALNAAGVMAGMQLDHHKAQDYFSESLQLWETSGDVRRQAVAHLNLGLVAHVTGQTEDAVRRLERATELFVIAGDASGQASAVGSLARLAREHNDLAEAARLTEQSLRLFQSVGDQWGTAFQLANVGHVRLALGDRRGAAAAFREALAAWQPLGNNIEIAECLDGVANAVADGQPRRAAQLLGAAEALREHSGGVVAAVEQQRYRDLVVRVQKRLREDTFAAAWREGRRLSMDQAINLTLRADEDDGTSAGIVLSQREREVAVLIAQGASNNDIAESLVVSIKTVESHVQRICRKLHVKRRTEVAAWAVRQGLI